uniref:Uncharacterized protein n=1 Tax=viral metagenome TaxID=1070528 RepID=A0A6M3IIP8_9ZZZZ
MAKSTSEKYYPPEDHSFEAAVWRRKMHQLLWTFLATHPKAEKREWPLFKARPMLPESYCYACEEGGGCDRCPIKNWGDGTDNCLTTSPDGSYYEQWLEADPTTKKGRASRKSLALKIARAWPAPKIEDFNK